MQKVLSHKLPMRSATAIAGVAILAPALGGSTQLWAQAVLLLTLAVLLIVAPPRQSPGAVWLTLLFAVAVLALTAFLPMRWFEMPEWRQSLLNSHELVLPGTRSPQPWLSAEAAGLLFAGIVFAGYLLAQPWDRETRRRALRLYAVGIVILAAAALACHLTHQKLPFWPRTLNSPIDFGFFPNRNQTANVLALAGIISTALAFDSFRRRSPIGWAWLAALLVIGAALVIGYSRAGIVLFLGGIAGWIIVAFFTSRSTARSRSRKSLTLGLAGVAVLLTLFFLFGGETLQRFQLRTGVPPTDFRVSIHQDAWRLAAKAPWLGQGLGNFEPIFAMSRSSSAGQNRALHPESDWLWTAVELGWPATLLLCGAFLLWLKNCLPFSRDSDRLLRSAAAVCGAAFALHGLVDVSGHRLGSLWPALFLASLALHPGRDLPPQRWVAPVFRFLGVLLAGISAWWLTSMVSPGGGRTAPTTHTLAHLVAQVERETAQRDFPQVLQTVEKALRISPLDWHLYYQRAVGRVATSSLPWVAARDFQTSRTLEPYWADGCFLEGKLWMSIDEPDYAMEAWSEALRRSGKNAPGFFSQMLASAKSRFSLHTALQELAQMDRSLQVVFLQYADRLECENEIGRLIEADPTLQELSPAERKMLFAAWFERGDRSLLISSLLERPDWLADGWPWLARSYAAQENFSRAYQIARQFGPSPTVPQFTASKSIPTLEQQFRFHPNNLQEGLELYAAQRTAGQFREAAATLGALQAIPGHPAYVRFLEANLRADLEEWEDAWKAWLRFVGPDFR